MAKRRGRKGKTNNQKTFWLISLEWLPDTIVKAFFSIVGKNSRLKPTKNDKQIKVYKSYENVGKTPVKKNIPLKWAAQNWTVKMVWIWLSIALHYIIIHTTFQQHANRWKITNIWQLNSRRKKTKKHELSVAPQLSTHQCGQKETGKKSKLKFANHNYGGTKQIIVIYRPAWNNKTKSFPNTLTFIDSGWIKEKSIFPTWRKIVWKQRKSEGKSFDHKKSVKYQISTIV